MNRTRRKRWRARAHGWIAQRFAGLIFQCYLVSIDSFMSHNTVFLDDDGFYAVLHDFFRHNLSWVSRGNCTRVHCIWVELLNRAITPILLWNNLPTYHTQCNSSIASNQPTNILIIIGRWLGVGLKSIFSPRERHEHELKATKSTLTHLLGGRWQTEWKPIGIDRRQHPQNHQNWRWRTTPYSLNRRGRGEGK